MRGAALAAAGAALAAAACGRGSSRVVEASGVDAAPRAGTAVHFATPAIRCSECHGKIHEEWSRSAHARSDGSPLYRAMRDDARARGATGCERCHAPLRAIVGDDERIASEGVTCDVCHAIPKVEERTAGAGFTLHLEDNVKYGPVCQGEAPYFHKLGCSPVHGESLFCAACHLLHHGDLPVFTEYEEWRASPQAAQGFDCQRCHMPSALAEVAVGSGAETGVAHHGWLGRADELRHHALAARVEIVPAGDGVDVTATVSNENAGHAVPTGLPGRRVILAIAVLDRDGKTVADWSREYARILVDETGREAPFYRARRVERDSRLAPRERRAEVARLPATAGGSIRARLIWRAVHPDVAADVGAPPPAEVVLADRRLPLGTKPAVLELAP